MVYTIQINKGTKNMDLGFACKVRNYYYAQKWGGGGGGGGGGEEKRSDSMESGNLIGGTSFQPFVAASRVGISSHLHTAINRSSD